MSKSNWDRGFVAGAKSGTKAERQRVIEHLKERAGDVKECHKDDSCIDLYWFAMGIIETIEEGEH